MTNMQAELIMDERYAFDDRSFAELVIWHLPRVLPGSAHRFKYRLACGRWCLHHPLRQRGRQR